ncbi:MAG: hypothetical protein R3B96_14180 [Pirellulaceae bacterium]
MISATRFLWFEDSIRMGRVRFDGRRLGFNAESIRGIPFTDPQRVA